MLEEDRKIMDAFENVDTLFSKLSDSILQSEIVVYRKGIYDQMTNN